MTSFTGGPYTRTDRMQSLLRGQASLLPAERHEFEQDLDDSSHTIRDIEARIIATNAILEKLHQSRSDELAFVQDIQCIMHPVQSLPNEILQEIFLLYTYNWEDLQQAPGFQDFGHRAPSVLAGVCGRWRDVALELPALWSCVLITSKTSLRPNIWLSPSRLCLSGQRGWDLVSCWFLDSNEKIMFGLSGRFSYLKRLSLRSLDSRTLAVLTKNPLPMLEVLDVSSVWLYADEASGFTSECAPELRELHFRGVDGVNYDKFLLPWRQITRFTISTRVAVKSRGIHRLTEMEGLKELCLQFDHCEGLTLPHDLRFPEVTRLELVESICSPDVAVSIVTFPPLIDAPNLVDLSIILLRDFGVREHTWPVLRVGMSGRVVKLRIECNLWLQTNRDLLLEYLLSTPRVEEFALSDYVLHEDIVAGLTLGSGVRRLPCLRVLDMGDFTGYVGDIAAMNRMIETRVGNEDGGRLAKIILPRDVYHHEDSTWRALFRSGALEVECGISKSMSDELEGWRSDEDTASETSGDDHSDSEWDYWGGSSLDSGIESHSEIESQSEFGTDDELEPGWREKFFSEEID